MLFVPRHLEDRMATKMTLWWHPGFTPLALECPPRRSQLLWWHTTKATTSKSNWTTYQVELKLQFADLFHFTIYQWHTKFLSVRLELFISPKLVLKMSSIFPETN